LEFEQSEAGSSTLVLVALEEIPHIFLYDVHSVFEDASTEYRKQ